MNVAAAASSSDCAIPSRRWEEETNSREMPIGVGRGVGEQERLVVVSTTMVVVVVVSRGGVVTFETGMIGMAEVMRWAITQPTMCSRRDGLSLWRRKR